MHGDKEQLQVNQENNIEAANTASGRLEELSNNPESSIELSPRDIEARTEKARIEALETAISVESGGKEKIKDNSSAASTSRGPIGKKQRDKSYTQTMQRVQNELPTSSRMFSKIIHNKFVEKTSDIVGSTVARPNAMLAGAFMAFILTLATYTVAKTIGYKLSGFETIASFIIGWLIGIIYDYLKVLFTGKKS